MTFSAPGRALRRHRIAQAGAVSAGLVLALTACGGGGEAEQSPTSTAPASSTNAATSTTMPATSSADSATEEQSSSAEASVDAFSTEATGVAESTDASDTEAGDSNGIEFETTGTYVPASEEGPAQNVPKPIMPAAMKENTPEGAEAAVRYWWEAMYYMQQTNDPEPLADASMDDCNLCSAYTKTVEEIYESDGWHSGSHPVMESILSQDMQTSMYHTTLITIESGRAYLHDGSVDPRTDLKTERSQPWSTVTHYDEEKSQWRVAEVVFEGNRG